MARNLEMVLIKSNMMDTCNKPYFPKLVFRLKS